MLDIDKTAEWQPKLAGRNIHFNEVINRDPYSSQSTCLQNC
jgi:hypothetical protein